MKNETFTETVKFRITKEQLTSLTEEAQGKQMKISELLRQKLFVPQNNVVPQLKTEIVPQIETNIESDKAHPLNAKAITLFKKPYNELNFNQKLRIKA